MTFNTGNPIGSTDARDLSDNAENFDKALGTLDATWTDRLGVTRDSFEGRLAKGSFYRVGDFATGYTLTNMRQTLEYSGHEYSWAGTFPKVVAAGSTPEISGGIGAGAWVDRTDVTLRNELLEGPLAILNDKFVLANFVSIKDFGVVGDGITNDTTAVLAYDTYCTDNSLDFDGEGLTFATTAPVLSAGTYKNAKFVPHSGHIGNGPTFKVNAFTGVCEHENITVTGYTNNGARISRGDYTEVATFIARGTNDYSLNGGKVQTVITSDVDMSTDFVIPVVDETGFSAGNLIWIGDGKYTILSIASGSITLVNNGSQATLVFGSRNPFKAGQFFTLDGDGKNGITIGDGGQAWNLDIQKGSITADNCGWFGLFHWANTRAGRQEIDTVHASNNGFIGVGLGYTNIGYARGCITEYNGNNGLDTLSSTSGFSIYGGVSRYNGVEGVYSGSNSNGEIAKLFNYDCRFNKRMGWLLNASTIAAKYSVHNVDARDNAFRSFTLTGCGIGSITKCKLGGAYFGNNFYIEGKNGCSGLQNHSIIDCIVSDNNGSESDIGGNVQDYVNTTLGILNIVNTYKESGDQISSSVSNVDPLKSKSIPAQRMEISVSATSVSAGSPITLTVNFTRVFNNSVTDLATNFTGFTVYTSATMATQSSLTSATRTAGVEITAGTTHWVASGNFGVITYSLVLSSAGSRYIVVEIAGIKKGILLTWV